MEATATQLWPVPALGIALAVVLAVVLTRVDARVDAHLPKALTDYLFTGGADSARAVLGAIASSLITVTSLTFSLTVVTLQLASSQFSPRLLRTFSRDRFVHVTLALFLATFVYALTVLRAVRAAGSRRTLFVPQIAVTVAYLLTLASVVALVLFLAHLARQIRVETMLRNVHTEADATADVMLVERAGSDAEPTIPEPPATAWLVMAGASGFLTSVNEDQLLGGAVDADAVLQVEVMPGGLVVADTPMAFAWAPNGRLLSETHFSALSGCVRGALRVGFERTSAQDIAFVLRQLTDVAIKALSPGVNDPTTAIHALGHSSSLLCGLTRYRLGPHVLADEEGVVRVVLCRPDLAELLELTVGQPRRYGAADPEVLTALFELLRSVGWRVSLPEHQAAVEIQLRRLQSTAGQQDFDDAERRRLGSLGEEVQAALRGGWRPTRASA
jgi:uncharacterized membrane protein